MFQSIKGKQRIVKILFFNDGLMNYNYYASQLKTHGTLT